MYIDLTFYAVFIPRKWFQVSGVSPAASGAGFITIRNEISSVSQTRVLGSRVLGSGFKGSGFNGSKLWIRDSRFGFGLQNSGLRRVGCAHRYDPRDEL